MEELRLGSKQKKKEENPELTELNPYSLDRTGQGRAGLGRLLCVGLVVR